MKKKKVFFFPEHDRLDPASRYGCYYLAGEIEKHGFDKIIVSSSIPYGEVKNFFLQKVLLIKQIIKYFFYLLKANKFNIIFIQRGLKCRGILEKIIFYLFFYNKKVFNRKTVIFLDDLVFTQGIKKMMKIANGTITGSHYLEEKAKEFSNNVFRISMFCNVKKAKIKIHNTKDEIVIGWIGTISNLKYLSILVEPLKYLGKKYKIQLRIITDPKGLDELEKLKFENIDLKLIPWEEKTEFDEIYKFDIGVMPLYNTELEKAKCGVKLFQYMACGIPAVASAVGENNYIIDNGLNGFLCVDETDWINNLEKLILDVELRKKIGQTSRQVALENYSLEVFAKKVAKFLNSL